MVLGCRNTWLAIVRKAELEGPSVFSSRALIHDQSVGCLPLLVMYKYYTLVKNSHLTQQSLLKTALNVRVK